MGILFVAGGCASVPQSARVDAESLIDYYYYQRSAAEPKHCKARETNRPSGLKLFRNYIPTGIYAGRSLLEPLFSKKSPPDYWNGLQKEILKTARAIRDGECGRPLDRLFADQGDSLLPDKIDPELQVQWTVLARPIDKESSVLSKILAVPLRARDAVFAVTKGESQIEIGGLRLHASAELRADTKINPDAIESKYEFPMTLRTRVWDEQGNSFNNSLRVKGVVALDRGSVSFYNGIYPYDTEGDQRKEMREHRFPAGGDLARVELLFHYVIQPR